MIDLVLVTWPNHPARLAYFGDCVNLLKKHLTASRHQIRWLCSAESERDEKQPWQGEALASLCEQHGIELHWREGKAGLGENMNAALRLCTAPCIFLVQDDFYLNTPLDLSPGAEFMVEHVEVDLLRYSWPGDERVTLIGCVDGWQRFKLDGGWPYGDDPHMRRPDFMERWGWYLENTTHGVSEGDMLHRLIRGNANIAAADKIYFGHGGAVTAVIDDPRERNVLR